MAEGAKEKALQLKDVASEKVQQLKRASIGGATDAVQKAG